MFVVRGSSEGYVPNHRVLVGITAAMSAVGIGDRLVLYVSPPAAIAAVVAIAAFTFCAMTSIARLPKRLLVGALSVAAAAAVVMVLIAYPIVDDRRESGAGTDSDDAISIGVKALADGRDPYRDETYLHGPIVPLPGSFVLGTPATAVTGRSGLTNLLAIGAFLASAVWALGRVGRRDELVLRLGALIALCWPCWLDLLSGADEFANGAWLSALTLGLSATHARLGLRAAIATGVVALTRAVSVLAIVPLWAYLYRHRSRRMVVRWSISSSVVVAVLLAPFSARIIRGAFPPFSVFDQKQSLSGLSPLAFRAITGLGPALALGLGGVFIHRRLPPTEMSLLVGCGAALSLPFVVLIGASPFGLGFAGYARLGLPFFLTAAAIADYAASAEATVANEL